MAKARFFYAIRPDAAAADALAALAARAASHWGGRAFSAHDIHLTLAFVGMRAVHDRPLLASILHDLPSTIETRNAATDAPGAAALALSRLGAFGHGVVWIGPEDESAPDATAPASWVHQLAGVLRDRLRGAAVAFDERPLRVHATLVRGARERPAPSAAFAVPTIVSREWSLALGWAGAASTPLRRYDWLSAGDGASP